MKHEPNTKLSETHRYRNQEFCENWNKIRSTNRSTPFWDSVHTIMSCATGLVVRRKLMMVGSGPPISQIDKKKAKSEGEQQQSIWLLPNRRWRTANVRSAEICYFSFNFSYSQLVARSRTFANVSRFHNSVRLFNFRWKMMNSNSDWNRSCGTNEMAIFGITKTTNKASKLCIRHVCLLFLKYNKILISGHNVRCVYVCVCAGTAHAARHFCLYSLAAVNIDVRWRIERDFRAALNVLVSLT